MSSAPRRVRNVEWRVLWKLSAILVIEDELLSGAKEVRSCRDGGLAGAYDWSSHPASQIPELRYLQLLVFLLIFNLPPSFISAFDGFLTVWINIPFDILL